MTEQPPAIACPGCGARASGRFCNQCGTPLGQTACPACGAAVRAGARFCAACGAAIAGTPVPGPGARNDRLPWYVAGVAVVALLVVLVVMLNRGAAPAAAVGANTAAPFAGAGGGGTPPDLSTMTPRERFDRLYNRIMTAAETGDESTVTTFTPMALAAYQQLDQVDADARYHLALLQVHTGDVAGPAALADTILANNPGHLFGYMIRGSIARWQNDTAALTRVYREFESHYQAEMAAARPEYGEHTRAVEEFHRSAMAAGS